MFPGAHMCYFITYIRPIARVISTHRQHTYMYIYIYIYIYVYVPLYTYMWSTHIYIYLFPFTYICSPLLIYVIFITQVRPYCVWREIWCPLKHIYTYICSPLHIYVIFITQVRPYCVWREIWCPLKLELGPWQHPRARPLWVSPYANCDLWKVYTWVCVCIYL